MKATQVRLPEIAKAKFSITGYGAVGDGRTSNTAAFRAAIEGAFQEGGGTVVVPPGIWLTGPIRLLSGIRLHVCAGAVVLFDKNREEYPVILTDYEGQPRLRAVSPLSADHAQNIAVTGQGILDGQGGLWRPLKDWKVTKKQWEECLERSPYVVSGKDGKQWLPSETIYQATVKGEISPFEEDAAQRACEHYDYYRPVMVSFTHCSRILIEGVTLQNSPAWNVHPLFCTDLTIRNAVIRNPYYAQNGDGLDLESCRMVHVHDVQFDVGDDAICMKSGKNAIARQTPGPTEHVWIHDCIVYHGHGGFVIGSEMSRGVRNISVKNCTFCGTDCGIRIKSAMGRGGVVEEIDIDSVQMIDIGKEAVILTMGYVLDPPVEIRSDAPSQEDIPEFCHIRMRNITCRGAKRAIVIEGLPEKPIHDITIEDSLFRADSGYTKRYAENIRLERVVIEHRVI